MMIQKSTFADMVLLGEDRVGKGLNPDVKDYVILTLSQYLKSCEATVDFYAYEQYARAAEADGSHSNTAYCRSISIVAWS